MRAAAFAFLISLCTAGAASAAPPERAALAERCPAPAALLTPSHALRETAAAIQKGGALRVLAVGSGSTSGQDDSGSASYPQRLVQALRQDLPKATIDLTVRGRLGMTAEEMLGVIETELAAGHFDAVIWQTGTVEAVRGIPPATLETILQTGAAKVRAAQADLILIGPQFSRTLMERVRIEPYSAALASVGAERGLALFDRLALTRLWVQDGKIDPAHATTRDERQAMLELWHACLGDALARFIANGVEQAAARSGNG